ncbi:MAG: helix-turn-helix transcriptional regulator [Sedimentisphaerales bacterium]|nr:helix-turn-helix transcriptional regulator [Sedimentisphaerales bacterium]
MAVVANTELISEQEWAQLQHRLGLSPRQAQIVREILHAKSDKQIAHDLNIALPTVRTHMGRLFRKFDLNDRIELVVHVFVSLRAHSRRSNGSLSKGAAV